MAQRALIEAGISRGVEIVPIRDIDSEEIARRTEGNILYSSIDTPPIPMEISWKKFGVTITGLRDVIQARSQSENDLLLSDRRDGLAAKAIISGVPISLLGSVIVMEGGSVSFVRPPQEDGEGNQTVSWITITRGKGVSMFSTSTGETFNRYPEIFKATQFMQELKTPKPLLPKT